jgi:hypothetical protein
MMSQEIIGFLRNIVNAEGQIDSPEAIAVDKIEVVFKKANKISLRKKVKEGWRSTKKNIDRVISKNKLSRGSK